MLRICRKINWKITHDNNKKKQTIFFEYGKDIKMAKFHGGFYDFGNFNDSLYFLDTSLDVRSISANLLSLLILTIETKE